MDFSTQLDLLIKEIEQDPNVNEALSKKLTPDDINKMSEEQLTRVRKLANPYGRTIQGSEKVHVLSVLNLKEDYMRKFQTTAIVGFIYRMQKEYLTDSYMTDTFVRRIRHGCCKEDFKPDDYDFIRRVYIDRIFDKNATSDVSTSDIANTIPSNENKYTLKKLENGNIVTVNLEKDFDFNDMFVQDICIYEETDEQYFTRKTFLQNETDVNNNNKREHVLEFLNSLFEYNPDMHVRRAREKVSGDRKANLDSMKNNSSTTQSAQLQTEQTEQVENHVLNSNKNVPLDTFSRIKYYSDTNFEEIREAVNMLYSTQPDIDLAINIYDSFTDSVKDNVNTTAQQQADNFISKHQNEVIADVVSVSGGKWALMGPFKENRKRVNFLNDNTKVIEDIFKQSEVDAKLGADLMKKRVLIKKKENERREGPIHPNFLRYTKENIPAVHGSGAQPVNDDTNLTTRPEEDNIIVSDIPMVEEKDAIEVPVFSVNLKDNTVKESLFYSKAEPIQKQ